MSQRKLRLFLDSNVLIAGIVSSWGLDKAILALCAAKVCQLVLAEVVRDEVEQALLIQPELSAAESARLRQVYRRLMKLTGPDLVPYPDAGLVRANRSLIRHEPDVPVLLSAMASRPDWLLTHNTKHFTKTVGQRTSLRIGTPADFFRTLSTLFA